MTFEDSALLQRRDEAGLASYTYLTRDRDDAEIAMTQELAANGHGPLPGSGTNGSGHHPSPQHPPPATPSSPAAQHGGTPVRGARRP